MACLLGSVSNQPPLTIAIEGLADGIVMARFGRATLYIAGLAIMFVLLVVTGGLGVLNTKKADLAVGIIFVFTTLVNMTTTGPVCYPIVAETPSGRLRYKTITIGRFVYNLTGIFSNSLTPRMVNSTSGCEW